MATRESSSTRRGRKTLILVFCSSILTALISNCEGQVLSIECSGSLYIPEDRPIGSTLFLLKATYSGGTYPGVNVTLTTAAYNTAELVNLTEAVYHPNDTAWVSDVVLKEELDREGLPVMKLFFTAAVNSSITTTHHCTLQIKDVNDNAPTFEGLPYHLDIPENSAVGTILLGGIRATDRDLNNAGNVYLSPKFSDSSVEDMFAISIVNAGQVQEMNITLAQPLDYETRSFYSFNIMATDGGGLNTTTSVRITVLDVQDTPPFFLQETYRAAIRENEPAGTVVISVSAEDGDRDPPNDVFYTIVYGGTDYFSINNKTGSITSTVILDRDNSSMVGSDGVFQLTVRATETDDVLPQYGNTTTEVVVVVMVEDVNDHPPTFSTTSPYTAFVREDTPLNTLVYFDGDGYIFVSDTDQGRNSHFNLTVERNGLPWSQLEATPPEVYSEGLILLRVMEADMFKGLGGTHLSFQLVAREVSTAERHSSTAEVIITVEQMPEPVPTAAPTTNNDITAPDIVVFVIGFLVIFNVVATILIIRYVRKRMETPRQGMARRGSKYYVHGVDRESKLSSAFLNGSAVSMRSESAVVEVDAKDRCDVVPLSALLDEDGVSNPAFSTETRPPSEEVGDSKSTERKVLIENEISPAKSASSGSMTAAAGSMSSASTAKAAVISPPDDMPDFTMATRNVSTPPNPALAYSLPRVPSTSSTSASAPATQVFPGSVSADNTVPSSDTVTPVFPVSAVATTASSVTSLTSASTSAPVEAVTRFSASGGKPKTTFATVTVDRPPSVSPASQSTLSSDGAAPSEKAKESMSEILY